MKREEEKRLVALMIRIYCNKTHKTKKGELCETCEQLRSYAYGQIDRCRFIETKTFCSSCKEPCYRPDMREKIREVMRFSGPRMIFYEPGCAIRHLLERKGIAIRKGKQC